MAKLLETGNRIEVAREWGVGEGQEELLNGYRVSIHKMKKF